MPQTSLRTLLALVVFPSLSALALYHTFGLLKADGTLQTLRAQCESSISSAASSLERTYFTSFTGNNPIDEQLCVLVRFFNIMISSSEALPFLAYGIGISLPIVVLPLVGSYKVGGSRLLGYPAIWGLLSQVATVGVVYPIYWLAVIMSTRTQDPKISGPRSFTTAEAQAIIFGVLVGAIIPSVAMIMLNDTEIILGWQFYPLLVSVASFGHLVWRPKESFSQPGLGLIQILYFGAFMVSSSVHIATVWPMIQNLDTLSKFLLPTATPLPTSLDIDLHLLNFLKWDLMFAFSATSLAMLWFTRSIKQCVAVLTWYIFSIPTVGFGAAVMGVAIWKDNILH
ncbi:hypothetical protein D9619_005888 [Psilocybe cf. subviscida]|uniref:Uncharacterized protein n=1 Tax=Psilocybe cf. subviscida TaxID=2480587 RepID=A0A8H5BW56_9AGAR|nr:hypothetical protein D9619_005888 [Psilocybe cf. subviscida]